MAKIPVNVPVIIVDQVAQMHNKVLPSQTREYYYGNLSTIQKFIEQSMAEYVRENLRRTVA